MSNEENTLLFSGKIKYTWQGQEYSMKVVTPDRLKLLPPTTADEALLLQVSEVAQMTLLAMTALAQDVYSRQPEGSRNFEEFVRLLRFKFVTEAGGEILVADTIQKR